MRDKFRCVACDEVFSKYAIRWRVYKGKSRTGTCAVCPKCATGLKKPKKHPGYHPFVQ